MLEATGLISNSAVYYSYHMILIQKATPNCSCQINAVEGEVHFLIKCGKIHKGQPHGHII